MASLIKVRPCWVDWHLISNSSSSFRVSLYNCTHSSLLAVSIHKGLPYSRKSWRGILFGGFMKSEAKLILAVFNLAVAEWTWSLFINNAPPINQNHACVLANCGNVWAAWEDTTSPSTSGTRPLEKLPFAKGNPRILQMRPLLQWWWIPLWSVT